MVRTMVLEFEDEKRIMRNYKRVKEECQDFQPSSFSIPAGAFTAGQGTYLITICGEFVKED